MVGMTEHVFAVRGHMVDGACVDLLLFAEEERAIDYVEKLNLPSGTLPLGFDYLEVVPRRVIGEIVDRRTAPRLRPLAEPKRRRMDNQS